MNTPTTPSIPLRALLACALASVGLSAFADSAHASAPERVKQRGKLLAGVSHVAPAYVAGAKFRTPEGMESILAEELAKRMQVTLAALPANGANSAQLLAAGKADVVLAAVPAANPRGRKLALALTLVPTGYAAGPMAIMRSDTDIKNWEQLKGRSVCLSETSAYAGTIASRYGATEKLFRAPADSLLALRIGQCDAAVHDSAMLNELLRLPEWKKFSATLPARQSVPLVFVVADSDAKMAAHLKQVAADWQKSGYLNQLVTKTARQIAFEVYLDQDVPDCH